MRRALAVVAWVAAYVAVIGAALVNPTVMGVAGIVAAVAATVWGLLAALSHDEPDDTPFPVDEPDRRPTWDTATWGAPE